MDLINEVDVTQKRLDELKESGVVLSAEQIENVKFEAIGRALTKKTDVLHAESGTVITTDYFEALLTMAISRFSTGDFFIITPEIQPLYNIQNEYIGFLYYDKVRNLKKEKRRSKNIRAILSVITFISMFVIGLNSSFFIIMMTIIAVISFGYYSLILGRYT